MTLRDVILAVEAEAKAQPAVNMIVRDDVFRLNECQTARYGVFSWTQQQHTAPADGDTLRVSLTLYYVDRLNEDASNRLEVQSMAVQVLTNIIRGLPGRGVWQTGDAASRAKGKVGRPLRFMVLGIPNVGKSSFINRLAGRKAAQTSDRPGVTRGKQWISLPNNIQLLDTPGILWPKFESEQVGLALAWTGAINDNILDIEHVASALLERMRELYPGAIEERYKFSPEPGVPGYEMLEQAGRKRGFLISGGEVNTERMARVLLDEFRAGKLGRVTLERP